MALSLQLIALLSISLFLSFFDFGRKLLFPIQVFTTWIHECCHALSAALLGGQAIRITLAPDGSGLTHYRISRGRLKQALIASSGYLGASAFGCALFYFTVHTQRSPIYSSPRTLAIILSVLIGLSLVVWIRNAFGFLSTVLLAVALAGLTYPPFTQYLHSILLFLAIQTALNALFDIRTLFSLGSQAKATSDAHQMAKLFYFPHWCWSFCWLIMSAAMMAWTVQKSI